MSAAEFLDTNILVYAYGSDARKTPLAQRLVEDACAGAGCISAQVLGEFSNVMLHKVPQPPGAAILHEYLDGLRRLRVVPLEARLVRRAIEAHEQCGIHFYDGMIIAAAEAARCRRIWSEDLNPGQSYFGIEVVNPFV